MNTDYVSYERFDGCYGEMTGSCKSGAYLTLDNGQEAFAYKFASLLPGTKVLCTVLKMPTGENVCSCLLIRLEDVLLWRHERRDEYPPQKRAFGKHIKLKMSEMNQ